MTCVRRALTALLVLVVFGALIPLVVQPATAEAQATTVVINEFLAINGSTLADNTGEFEDWIELRNTSGSSVDLGGWTLSDGIDAFVFPNGTTIAGNGYRLVWASGDVTRTTATDVHLPFKLSGTGEPLTLRDPGGAVSSPAWAAPAIYPPQLEDDSYGISSTGQLAYFTDPTPGAANGAGSNGLVLPVTFSVDHGFYSTPQTLVLDSPTSGATIRYTTNGDVPTSTTGTQLAAGGSLAISATTTVRAVAYRDGWITSPVETRTYLFTSDIITQSGTPAGFPSSSVNGQVNDYGMDPDVVTGNETAVQNALEAIPTLSIVTDLDNLFDPSTGIWVNAGNRGAAWERQASIELIDPSGAQDGFDIEGGLRIRGGFSRSDSNPKHSLRLFFRDDYEAELDYPLFGDEGADLFEKVDLRTSQNYGWQWRRSANDDRATWVDELWSRDSQGAMGQPYTRSRQYHVYLNGNYWGIYMTQERVSGEYGESYFGGDEDDYDVVKRGAPGVEFEATNGSDADWRALHALVSDLNVTNTEFETIAADVDLVNLADFYLLHFYSGDYDSTPSWFLRSAGSWSRSNNWYALRNNTEVGPAAKWQFFDHDSEHSLCAPSGPGLRENIDNTTPWNLQASFGSNDMSPAWLHAALISNAAYRQIFADRVQLHMLTPGGALTLAESNARLDARIAELSGAIEGESARWGDGAGHSADIPYGRDEWESNLQILRDCFSARLPIVESQLRADGLWPLSDAPTINPAAGAVAYGTNVIADPGGQNGILYVTTDDADPRATDGSVASTAQVYTGPLSVTADVTVKARVLDGGQWSPLAEASYSLATAPGPVTLALNEFNAVSGSTFLGGGTSADTANGTDASLGRVAGNGGDWFELVVIDDGLDIRGWTVEVWSLVDGVMAPNASLTFGDDNILADLLAGSLVTVSEDIADDVSYNPIQGDWHINLQANDALDGAYITAASQTNFGISNASTQIAIFDASGTPVQLRTGEGTAPNAGVSSTEVFKLEGTPTTALTPDSALYDDGTSSSWGLPNTWSSGNEVQNLDNLRVAFGDVNCDGQVTIGDALVIAQFSVGTRTDAGSCPLANPATQLFAAAADVNANGQGDIGDALLVAQCTVGLTNSFCTN